MHLIACDDVMVTCDCGGNFENCPVVRGPSVGHGTCCWVAGHGDRYICGMSVLVQVHVLHDLFFMHC